MEYHNKFNDFINKYKLVISGILILIILGSGGLLLYSNQKKGGIEIVNPDQNKGESICKVDIEGAVRHPGVYNLKPDDRVEDAIKLAGGPLPEADLSKVSKSLASRVTDEERILVPFISTVGSSGTANQEDKININTATLAGLDSLPGIGEATGQKIIDYREQNGYFSSIEDIMNVSGIGQAKFDKMKDMITI
jgi:competence protein ComEA